MPFFFCWRLWRAPGLISPVLAETIVKKRVKNVSVPELWVYLPQAPGKNRSTLLICAGGGYGHLAIGLHVGNVIKLFHEKQIVVLALKYRTRYGKNDPAADALTDSRRAMRLIRQHAAEWGIDPNRVGIQGYSAGANVCLNLLGHFDLGNSASADPVEQFSCRPDFVALMCLWPHGKTADAYPICSNPPPVFLAAAEDDKTAPIAFSRDIASAIERQGGKVQFFVVPSGGHAAFHYGVSTGPGVKWPEAFLAWMPSPDTIGTLSRNKEKHHE
ncbi:MAG: alpha/beta hydrolase [Kiritimatiellaeota bacterium]|nr:alpha/beta hydrolase [Kiritimatiellota bacterium]